ncbi:protein of unknown function [Bradyrhizobium vignae]|uniref:Uncharacterized protein n=1 Tax=Bradyrhizobium vignae TaxID=1549949 RepID=A0A2U3PVI5_9BRAD|nr:protein of unknown function [Bradyrhizobium vignae]
MKSSRHSGNSVRCPRSASQRSASSIPPKESQGIITAALRFHTARVNRVGLIVCQPLPVYPKLQTCHGIAASEAMGQKPTSELAFGSLRWLTGIIELRPRKLSSWLLFWRSREFIL